MKLLMIEFGDYTTDLRIRREAEHLQKSGFDVDVICGEVPNKSQRYETLNNVNIEKIGPKHKISKILIDASHYSAWYSPYWSYKLYDKINSTEYDVMYYHDLHLSRIAARLSNWFDIPLVADLHEPYPLAIRMWRRDLSLKQKMRPRHIVTAPRRYDRLERLAVKNADGLITVSEELKTYLIDEYGVQNDASVVRNVPDLSRLDSISLRDIGYQDEFIISYIGGFTPQRGLDVAIEAMQMILKDIPEAKLFLVGDGPESHVDDLKQKVQDVGLNESVQFTGWVEFSEAMSILSASEISIIPYVEGDASRFSLPNKLFQSMAFSTPVVASNLNAMSRIISDTNAGDVFITENPRSLANVIINLYHDDERRKAMGAKGREAAEHEYNIENEIMSATSILESITN